MTQARNAAQQAFAQWDDYTKFQFTELTSGTADIMIRFSWQSSWGDSLASTSSPGDGGDVWFNPGYSWSAASPTPSGSYDVNTLMIHELGHALGLAHSSYSEGVPDSERAVMFPTFDAGSQRRLTKPDDRVSSQARNIRWTEFDNWSVDIDIGDGPMFHHTYVTGGNVVSGGREVWALQNGVWVLYGGQGAVRIAGKGSGNVWIVQDDGDIYQRVNGAWQPRSGCGKDIAVGSDNSVWLVGCSTAPGGFNIFKWSGSSWGSPATGGIGAVRISFGKYFNNATTLVPWIVQDDGDIYRRNSNSASSGSWGSPLPGRATDISANQVGFTWMLGFNAVSGGYRVYAWNEQGEIEEAAGPGSGAEERKDWVLVPGATGLNIATDSGGNPYVVDTSERAFW
jgi:hypothetical protein